MRALLSATCAAVLAAAGPLAASPPALEPLPVQARALANDVASRSTANEKAWADEAGRRRPLPTYLALTSEVRATFATRRRMSEVEIRRLAYLAFVKGFDDATAEHVRRSAGLAPARPTPAPRAQPATGPRSPQGTVSTEAELSMIRIQSLVSQRQLVIDLTTTLLAEMNATSRTVVGNIRP